MKTKKKTKQTKVVYHDPGCGCQACLDRWWQESRLREELNSDSEMGAKK